MAEDEDALWTFEVESVSRINPDPTEENGEVTYAVVFDANGPNARAEIEVFVDPVTDPSQIVSRAMSQLHEALAAWARVTAGRHIASDDSTTA